MKHGHVHPYAGHRRIGLVGLGRWGMDGQIRAGIFHYRGLTRPWLIYDLGHGGEQMSRLCKGAHRMAWDGFIARCGNPAVAELLRRTDKPVVDLNSPPARPAWATHRLDDQAVGALAGAYFKGLGHRHFLYVSESERGFERERWEGFRRAIAPGAESLAWVRLGDGLRVTEILPRPRELTPRIATGLFLSRQPRPAAVFTAMDGLGAALCDLAVLRQIRVPDELSFLGCDNFEVVCECAARPLSSIALPGEPLGRLAAEHLECLMERRDPPALRSLPPERVVVRVSTDTLAIRDPIVAEALARMRSRAGERVRIETLVRGLPISRRAFSDRFRAALGRSPLEELSRWRVQMARERLATTDHTLYRIAMECGFADALSMTRQFKAQLGVTPGRFRATVRAGA